VKVHYGEGVATHTGPESCTLRREASREALTGVCVGQVVSGEGNVVRGADAVVAEEGNRGGCDSASNNSNGAPTQRCSEQIVLCCHRFGHALKYLGDLVVFLMSSLGTWLTARRQTLIAKRRKLRGWRQQWIFRDEQGHMERGSLWRRKEAKPAGRCRKAMPDGTHALAGEALGKRLSRFTLSSPKP
jgi:hypothetical protein